MTQLTKKEIETLIDKKVQERTELLMKALEIDYDSTKLTMDFDSQKAGWDKVNAVCILRAAAIAYRSPEYIGMELKRCGVKEKGVDWDFFEHEKTNTQAFAFIKDKAIIIAFRGTETKEKSNQINDLLTDLKIKRFPFDPQNYEDPVSLNDPKTEFGEVHSGFLKAINSVWGPISKFIEQAQKTGANKLWFTGHSLGAALAVLGAAKIQFNPVSWPVEKFETCGLYTIGQPRVGNLTFASKLEEAIKDRYIRIVNNNDPVTNIPLKFWKFRHSGKIYYIDRKGKFRLDMSELNRKKDKWLGKRDYLLLVAKSLILKQFGLKVAMPSPIADHDRHGYVSSLREYRDRDKNKPR